MLLTLVVSIGQFKTLVNIRSRQLPAALTGTEDHPDNTMSVEGVIVSYNHTRDQSIVTVAASGILFSKRWVLAHGSMLSLLEQAKEIDRLKNKPILHEEFYNNLPEIYVTCEAPKDETSLPNNTKQLELLSRHRNAEELESHSSYQIRVLTGQICHVWKCPILDRCINDILYSWTIGHKDGNIEEQTDLGKSLLSVFVLIDLESDVRGLKTLRPLSELLDLVRPPPDRGSTLEVYSTPFGCEAFLNTVTKGSVCGVLGKRPCLLMTDAATAIGSEGGPVMAGPQSNLIGMVISSVSWSRGEWVGLSLVAPLITVLTTKLRVAKIERPLTKEASDTLIQLINIIDCGSVLVRCGPTWGTGVYIGGGHVLTCAHVIASYSTEKVTIYSQGVKETAIVRYKTADQKAYDLALLYTNPENWEHLVPIKFAEKPVCKGDNVIAAGFPFFNENHLHDIRPTISAGHVSNVSPTMMQTSCCVQSGFSGGPIYKLTHQSHKIELVGVIVCNAQTQDLKACYPFINLAVPVHAFKGFILEYMIHRDKTKLQLMEHNKEIVQSQWKLMPYKSKI